MTEAIIPSPTIAIIELRALISAGANIPTAVATRLTDVLRDSFAAWSDAAENANELTILIMQGKLEPWQQTYALQLLEAMERALPRKHG